MTTPNGSIVRKRRQATFLATMLLAAVATYGSVLAAQAEPQGFTWVATIQHRPANTIDATRPLLLGRQDITRVVLELQNNGQSPVSVRSVRLDGQVIGLTFFNFSARIDAEIPPGAHSTRTVDLDLSDLTSQANGLIPAHLSLIGVDRKQIGTLSFPVDVRGSLFSVYGVFGLAVGGMTVVLLGSLLLSIWQRRLPINRWQRALRFFAVGIGAGLTLTFSLSTLRILVPNAVSWVSLVLVLGGGAFLLGYVLPLGRTEREAEDDADRDDQADRHDQDADSVSAGHT